MSISGRAKMLLDAAAQLRKRQNEIIWWGENRMSGSDLAGTVGIGGTTERAFFEWTARITP
jgi:hypothetical protein